MIVSNIIKSYSKDVMYSVLGLCIMNAVTQFIVYPVFQKRFGEVVFGDILSLISIIAIMGTSFGCAANYSRIMAQTRHTDSSGDYNIFLMFVFAICTPIALIGIKCIDYCSISNCLLYVLLMFMTILRYYNDIEFRLCVDYRGFFVYYFLIAVGNIVGIICINKIWMIPLILGETLAFLYVVVNKKLYKRKLWNKSDNFDINKKSLVVLSVTFLLEAVVVNSDRLILQWLDGGKTVTVFYIATLIGKIIGMISAPINSVIVGHLSKYQGNITYSFFRKLGVIAILCAIILNMFCIVMSVVFIKVLYPNLFSEVVSYLWISNLGQIFYFVSGILCVVLMRFTNEKYQFYIQIIYFIVFFIIAVPLAFMFNLFGMFIAVLIASIVRIVAITCIAKLKLKV